MRAGVRLGIDPGDARIGVARCDPAGIIATPVETVRRGKGDLRRIGQLVRAEEAMEVVVGLPRSLGGGEGPAAAKVRDLAARLAQRLAPIPVRLIDERLSTVSAEAMLRDQRKGARRREVIDQAAAVVILQQALDTERATGRPPGELVGLVGIEHDAQQAEHVGGHSTDDHTGEGAGESVGGSAGNDEETHE